MNNRPLDDAKLDQRLRTGFEALAREAGHVPALATDRSIPEREPRSRRIAMAAGVVLVTLAAGGVAWTMRGGGEPDQRITAGPAQHPTSASQTTADRPLVGTQWWLVGAERDGNPVDLGDRQPIGLQLADGSRCEPGSYIRCPSAGPTLWASDACNGVTGMFELPSPGTLKLGARTGMSTLMGCGGPLVELLSAVYVPGVIGYRVRGDELVVTRDNALLTYAADEADTPERTTVPPTPDARRWIVSNAPDAPPSLGPPITGPVDMGPQEVEISTATHEGLGDLRRILAEAVGVGVSSFRVERAADYLDEDGNRIHTGTLRSGSFDIRVQWQQLGEPLKLLPAERPSARPNARYSPTPEGELLAVEGPDVSGIAAGDSRLYFVTPTGSMVMLTTITLPPAPADETVGTRPSLDHLVAAVKKRSQWAHE